MHVDVAMATQAPLSMYVPGAHKFMHTASLSLGVILPPGHRVQLPFSSSLYVTPFKQVWWVRTLTSELHSLAALQALIAML